MPKTEFYRDAAGEWRWHTKSPNGLIVAEPGEGYKTRAGARKGLDRARRFITVTSPECVWTLTPYNGTLVWVHPCWPYFEKALSREDGDRILNMRGADFCCFCGRMIKKGVDDD